MIQETLEEAASEYANKELNKELTSKVGNFYGFYSSFKAGAKWQAERMYSDEEVKDMLFEALNKKQEQCCITNTKDSIVREVLKEFKNK